MVSSDWDTEKETGFIIKLIIDCTKQYYYFRLYSPEETKNSENDGLNDLTHFDSDKIKTLHLNLNFKMTVENLKYISTESAPEGKSYILKFKAQQVKYRVHKVRVHSLENSTHFKTKHDPFNA